MKYTIQEEIWDHFLDHAVELLKQGKKLVLVLDNIDWDVRVHNMRSDNQNKSVHAVAKSIVFNCVSSDHLPDDKPKKNLANSSLKDLLMLLMRKRDVLKSAIKSFLEEYCASGFQPLISSRRFCHLIHPASINTK